MVMENLASKAPRFVWPDLFSLFNPIMPKPSPREKHTGAWKLLRLTRAKLPKSLLFFLSLSRSQQLLAAAKPIRPPVPMPWKISKNAASCSVVNFYLPARKKVFIRRSQGEKQAVGDLIHFMRPFIAFYYSFLFACQSNGIKTPACAFADLLLYAGADICSPDE